MTTPNPIPEGMKAYGPEHPDYPNAPSDWDGGDLLLDWGDDDDTQPRFTTCQQEEIDWSAPPSPWRHDIDTDSFALIIAYTPKPTPHVGDSAAEHGHPTQVGADDEPTTAFGISKRRYEEKQATNDGEHLAVAKGGEALRFWLSQQGSTMVEVCEPHPGNPAANIFPIARAELLAALAEPPAMPMPDRELREALEPFARLAGPINGEEGRPSYIDAIGGDDAGEELQLSTYAGNGTRIEVMHAEDFRRAAKAFALLSQDRGEGVDQARTIEILRRALAWHGDQQRMATTREEWQQEIDTAIAWVRANPEEGRPSFSSFATLPSPASGEGERNDG